MKNWMKKIAVMLITMVTLGFYVPSMNITANTNADNNKDSFSAKKSTEKESNFHPTAAERIEINHFQDFTVPLRVQDYAFLDLQETAHKLTYQKLGPKITEQIEEEIINEVFPAMEKTFQTFIQKTSEKDLSYYRVTKFPTMGLGERIFHLTDMRTGEDVLKFHVRRDHRPWEGYWFNFHYHMKKDQFEQHHVLSNVYWDKNKPPQWKS